MDSIKDHCARCSHPRYVHTGHDGCGEPSCPCRAFTEQPRPRPPFQPKSRPEGGAEALGSAAVEATEPVPGSTGRCQRCGHEHTIREGIYGLKCPACGWDSWLPPPTFKAKEEKYAKQIIGFGEVERLRQQLAEAQEERDYLQKRHEQMLEQLHAVTSALCRVVMKEPAKKRYVQPSVKTRRIGSDE